MSKQTQNMPALRFPEFRGGWGESELNKVGSFKNGLNKDKDDFGFGFPFVNLMDIFGRSSISEAEFSLVNANEKDLKLYNLIKGDVLFIRSSVKRSGVGEAAVILNDLSNTVYSGFIIRFRESDSHFDLNYKKYCFSSFAVRKQILTLSTSSANTNINQDSLGKVRIIYPQKEEQQKIAAFLGAVDEKITGLEAKKGLLEAYKKGMMQQLFTQQIRFKDNNGQAFPDWEEKELGEITQRITNKNTDDAIGAVLTNSATQGIVAQQDYFDKDIANQDNLQGYYVVETDDFVYNPRISKHAPVGPIKRNHLSRGVMSPLYSVFKFKEGNSNFFERYFQTTLRHKYMHSVANIGARHDRMNIVTSDFQGMPMPFPHPEEQQKIAAFLTALDDKIVLVGAELSGAQDFKKALLQQIFV